MYKIIMFLKMDHYNVQGIYILLPSQSFPEI